METLENLKNRIKPLLWGALMLAGVYFILSYAHYMGVAHAAGMDPEATTAITGVGDSTWDLASKDGPAWAVLLVAAGLLRTFLNKQHWLAQGKVLSGLTGLSMVAASVLAWRFVGAPASGILTAIFAAYTLITHSQVPGAMAKTDAPAAPPAGPSGPAVGSLSMLALLLLGGVLVTSGSACSATTKARAVNAATAALNCESDGLKPLVAELVPLAVQYVLSIVSSDGKAVDKSALSKAWSGVKSDQGRCALATAIAVLATPTAPVAGAPAAAELEIDPVALKAAYLEIRVAHGWGETTTAAGTL